jgi:hypothetical protein
MTGQRDDRASLLGRPKRRGVVGANACRSVASAARRRISEPSLLRRAARGIRFGQAQLSTINVKTT